MGPKMKVVPYATVDDRRDVPFTRELELASLFVLAEARRGREPLSGITLVYYPFHIRSWEGRILLIDQLGLNRTQIRYRIIPDVEDFKRAVDATSSDPDAFSKTLMEKGPVFKGFAGRKNVSINGLIVQPGKSKELSEILEKTKALDPIDEPAVFKPILNSDDIASIIDSIRSLRRDIEGDVKSLNEAKRSLKGALETSRKALENEIEEIRARGAEAKARMMKDFERAKRRYGEMLERNLKEIREEYKKKSAPFTRERKRIKRKLSKRRRKLEQLRAEGADPTEAESLSGEIEAKVKEVEDSISSLRDRREAEVGEARARYKADLGSEEDKIREEEARCRDEAQRRVKEISELKAAAKKVTVQINRLIRSKRGKLGSLSRLCFDLKTETADLYVPFYVFHYGGRKFDFYPPVVASGARGLLSRFKRMFADNIQSKITQLIRPRTDFMETYLAKAVRTLSMRKGTAPAHRRAVDGLNLLRSREAVDKIMAGLVKIRREGWIGDNEYIRLQEFLVENLGLISRP